MNPDTASDEALIQALPDRLVALEALYERHARHALGLALRILGDRQAAEDVVQEAFLALWRAAPSYHPGRASVRSWLLGIVHHCAVDRLRGRASVAPFPDGLGADPGAPDPAILAAQRLDRAEIQRALDAFSPEQRQALELAYFAGLTQAQIAAALGVPLGTVKGRMRLALARLRGLLRDQVEGGGR